MFEWLRNAFMAIKYMDYDKIEMAELLEINVKFGRRAAYDLRHATSCLHSMIVEHGGDDRLWRSLDDKARFYETVFNPSHGLKDYRTRMYFEIHKLERRVKTLEQICEEHNIPPYGPDDIPF